MNCARRTLAAALVVAAALAACERTPAPASTPAGKTATAPAATARGADAAVDLRAFDREVVERLRRLPDTELTPVERSILQRGTSLNPPAEAPELAALTEKFGKPLPPSYRAFLETSNGMTFEGALNAVTMFDTNSVAPLTDQNYPGRDAWLGTPDVSVPLDAAAGGPLPGAALARAWMISSSEDGDVYLIFPDLAGPDGEWPVWFLGPKNPGAYGYPSFGAMLARERPRALAGLDARAQRKR